MSGRVILVGAGPGDPDLLTVRALRELQRAEVLLYDALISPAILALARPGCLRVDVGKRGDGSRGVPQERIAELLIEHARAGARVVRLKGGDPFVFGRGGEEASALVAAGIPFEVVPGVSSAIAVPAYAGIPVTDRRYSSSFTVVTAHRGKEAEDKRTDWEGLARSSETLVILMGTAWLEDVAARVMRGGRDPATPAAIISHGTTGEQRTIVATLGEIAARAREARLGPPAIVVIGEVVRFRENLGWYEARPLFGRRALILRSAEDSTDLAVALSARGAIPVCVPLLELTVAEDGGEALRTALAECPYAWIVFTSETAVRFTAAELRAAGLLSPSAGQARIACVGPATARAARHAGLDVAIEASGIGGGEALAPLLGDVTGNRVLLPRSGLASEALPRALRERGAHVVAVEAYRNALPPGAGAALEPALASGIDAVLLTSPSTLERLADLLGPERLRELVERATVACIGATTAAALRARGYEPSCVALEPTSEGLVAALERYHVEHGVLPRAETAPTPVE